jgi:hypothetical protein
MNPIAAIVAILIALVVFWLVAHVSVILAVIAALLVLAFAFQPLYRGGGRL